MKRALIAAAILLALAATAGGMFMMPNQIPADRLIKNAEAYIKENPKDAQGYYVLARLHYLAYRLNEIVAGYEFPQQGRKGAQLPNVADNDFQNFSKPPRPTDKITSETRGAHIAAAVENFNQAIKLQDSALHHLGLASVLDQCADASLILGRVPGDLIEPTLEQVVQTREAALKVALPKLADADQKVRDEASAEITKYMPQGASYLIANMPKNPEAQGRVENILRAIWRERAIAEYKIAYDKSIKEDLALKFMPLKGLQSMISYEAGHAYIRLTKERGASADEKKTSDAIAADLEKLKNKQMGPVTPIIFALESPRELADLIDETARVSFDLDGTKRTQTYNWVKPSTAILAWDPDHTGKITSGHQLFGSVSFQLILTDGYRALDLLDDNRDGKLTKGELAGLAVWRDANSNGISDAGEVTPIEQTEIAQLATRPTANLAASNGVTLKSGRTLPSYDWLAEPK